MQTVYQTDGEGYYVGEEVAFDDPLTPGAVLIPAGCVVDAPPQAGQNQVAKRENDTWVLAPDYRGTVYWLADRSRHEITERGVSLPLGAMLEEPPPEPPSPEQIIATLTAAVQAHLDTTANSRNYDGILSLCSYAASAHPVFGPQGRAGVIFRDDTWATCYAILADVKAGNRTAPTEAELLAELPDMEWPA